jgi:hypothetical protein
VVEHDDWRPLCHLGLPLLRLGQVRLSWPQQAFRVAKEDLAVQPILPIAVDCADCGWVGRVIGNDRVRVVDCGTGFLLLAQAVVGHR